MSFPVTDGVETVMPPPPGWKVNFDHPTRDEDVAREAFWITGFELFIATGFLAQRLYTKLFIVKKLQIDDCRSAPSPRYEPFLTSFLRRFTHLGLCMAGEKRTHTWKK